ncbi:putative Ser/Thr protein phosphatase [Paratrimastix pyriformis]|uniref:Ser/Thr protein phosphatase n=1 Tax=Paratrimastix pyriformis TaxID=342808 RepID=A0ABQ8UPH8_9EUKA|nr:putative Ser/Thr protein phosphatase [Paratrimastix pyriformis]
MRLLLFAIALLPFYVRAESFWLVTDFHMDSHYTGYVDSSQPKNCWAQKGSAPPQTFGRYGCDPNMELVNLFTGSMKTIDPKPSFILLNGDFCGHDISSGEKFDTVRTVYQSYAQSFPNVPLLPSLGNDDALDNYQLACGPNNDYYNKLSEVFNATGMTFQTSDDMATFQRGGYYSYSPLPNLRIIVLNTVLYSPSNRNFDTSRDSDPCGQFAWLQTTMAKAQQKGESVVVMAHIPPTDNGYDSQFLWRDAYADRWFSLLSANRQIPLSIFGHLHHDGWVLLRPSDVHALAVRVGRIPANAPAPNRADDVPFHAHLYAPSVTPSQGNNPGIRRFTLAQDGASKWLVGDYNQYFLDIERAYFMNKTALTLGYSISDHLRPTEVKIGLGPVAFTTLAMQMASNARIYAEWSMRHEVYSSLKQHQYLCAMMHSSREQYNQCVATYGGAAMM